MSLIEGNPHKGQVRINGKPGSREIPHIFHIFLSPKSKMSHKVLLTHLCYIYAFFLCIRHPTWGCTNIHSGISHLNLFILDLQFLLETNLAACSSGPCKNNGFCFDASSESHKRHLAHADDYECFCPNGFAGKDCECKGLFSEYVDF